MHHFHFFFRPCLVWPACEADRWGAGCTNLCPSCVNGGVCDDVTGKCICPPGFHGDLCEIGTSAFWILSLFACNIFPWCWYIYCTLYPIDSHTGTSYMRPMGTTRGLFLTGLEVIFGRHIMSSICHIAKRQARETESSYELSELVIRCGIDSII